MNNIIYTKTISEPWFSLIKLGIKNVEGRLDKNDFVKIKKGDIIKLTNNIFGFNREFNITVQSVKKYTNFEEYLNEEGLDSCLPGIDSIEEGLYIYYTYYTKTDEEIFGVKAIRF